MTALQAYGVFMMIIWVPKEKSEYVFVRWAGVLVGLVLAIIGAP